MLVLFVFAYFLLSGGKFIVRTWIFMQVNHTTDVLKIYYGRILSIAKLFTPVFIWFPPLVKCYNIRTNWQIP